MTTKITMFVSAIATMFTLAACGVQEGGDMFPPDADPVCMSDEDCADGETCTADGACVPADDGEGYLPDPFRSPAACVLDFSSRYVSGASCGEVRGTMPLMTWEEGLYADDTDGDGYLGMSFDSDLPAGTYDISYVGFQDCESGSLHHAWAHYGHEEDLSRMRPEALEYIHCNWYDADAGEYLNDVEEPHCNIRISVDEQCNITPAGNMGHFAD